MLRTPLGRLRAIGLLEGVSFLVLLGVAMPLKYAAGRPGAVLAVGWAHGLLFLLYVAAVLNAWAARRWPVGRAVVAGLASVVPFGPFLLDPSLRREQATIGS